MACLAKCYPFGVCVCVCERDSSGIISAVRIKTMSPAGGEPQVLLEIKQEINALWNKHTQVSHIFSVASLLPAAASNHLRFCTFSFFSNTHKREPERERERKQSHIVISDCKTSDLPLIPVPQRGFRRWPVSPLKTCVYIHLVNHVNRSKIFGINKHLKECHSWFLSVTVISPVQS